MLDHPLPSPSSICRRLHALAYLIVLGLGASQAGALPPVQADPAAASLPAEGEPPGSAQLSAADQQAPLADLNEVLEATRAKLEELNAATGIVASSTKLEGVQALEADNQRLTTQLTQALTRQSELQSGSERAEARIAELTKALEAARRESARRDEEVARLRRQNAELNQSVERADAEREAATARADRAEVAMTERIEAATDAAARAKAELAAMKIQLDQTAGAAVEAERARRSATSGADALRGDAARARQELTAARAEIERLSATNAGLEQQIGSLHMELRSATATARQNLTLMAEKMAALNAALESVRSDAATPPISPQAEQHPAADAVAPPATSPAPRPPAPEPADDTEASRPADDVTDVATAEPNPAPAAVDGSLARFHADIAALNELELSTAGAGLFSGVRSVSGREVHVGTTAAWESLPPIGQQSYIDSLLEYWVAARGGDGPAIVRIVDPSGRVLVEKSTP